MTAVLSPLLLEVWSTDLQDVSEHSGLGPPTGTSASHSQAPQSGSPGAAGLSLKYKCQSPGVELGISGLISDCDVEFFGPGPFCRARWVVLLCSQGDSHCTHIGGPVKYLVASVLCHDGAKSEATG